MEWLYKNDEIIIVHPEGTRKPYRMGRIKKEMIDFTKKMQEKHNKNIPIIPVGIEYSSIWGLRSSVYLRAGSQFNATNPDINEIVEREIKRLSGL